MKCLLPLLALVLQGAALDSAQAEDSLRVQVLKKKRSTQESPTFPKHFPITPIAHPQWKSYLTNLSSYQSAYPGIYTPADLVRWDKLPPEWLRTHVRKHGLIWERSEAKPLAFEDRRLERVVISRKTNQELFEALQTLEKQGTLWIGSTRALLDSFNTEDRIALTPLDEAFQKSDLGSQLFKRFSEKSSSSLNGFLVDRKSGRMILELGGASSAENPSYFKVEFLPQGDAETRVRPIFGREERLGADILFRKENFRSYLLNKESVEKLPLGPYPAKANQWLDERGTSHFHGDGHKH